MVKTSVNKFTGRSVHGGGGAYRYEGPGGKVVHVHPEQTRGGDGWAEATRGDAGNLRGFTS